MDQYYSNTNEAIRKPRTHLTLDERGMIQALSRQGFSLRRIAEAIGCSHTTVYYELKKRTPERNGNKGRNPLYTAKRAHKSYLECRKNSKRPHKVDDARCEPFIHWLSERVRKDHWSVDACAGYARQHGMFASEDIPCTKTIYNALWNGKLPISLFDVPYALNARSIGNGLARTNVFMNAA